MLRKLLKKHVYTYKDAKKNFFTNVLKRIPFLKDIDSEQFHEIMFSLSEEHLIAGGKVLLPGDPVERIIIVKSGELEVFKEYETNKFVLAKMGSGSILNHRNFLIENEEM